MKTQPTSKYIGLRLEKEHMQKLQDNMNGEPEYGIIYEEETNRFIIESWVHYAPIGAIPWWTILVPIMLHVPKTMVYGLMLDDAK